MEVCSSLRGTSCLCTKVRQWRWMGIRPRGEGLRLKSRQDQPVDSRRAELGDRWPLASGDLPLGTGVAVAGGSVPTGVRLLSLVVARGLLLLVRARRSPLWPSSSGLSSTGWGVGGRFLREADLVVGPKYEGSREADSRSEGVGLGEMTRGVAGMTGLVAKGMASVGKGGRGDELMVPEKRLRIWPTRTKGQREKEKKKDAEEEEWE